MIAIVGLGNHERQYHSHRHNAGFMFVDFVYDQIQNSKFKVQNYTSKFKSDKYLFSDIFEGELNNTKLLLTKPTTFMNLSGKAVSAIVKNFKLEIDNLIIVHDDLDIPLGKFKIDRGSGPKQHNGLLSIEQHLGTHDFWRVRLGVDNRTPDHHIPGEAYVLNDFLPEERKIIVEDVFPKVFLRLKIEILDNNK